MLFRSGNVRGIETQNGSIFLLVGDMLMRGMERLNLDFFTNFASRKAAQSGILSAWVGSILVILTTALIAIPVGVMAGVYLEEYAPKNWFTAIIEINVTNLAGVPSIVYGLLALSLFVYGMGFGQSILSAGLTLALPAGRAQYQVTHPAGVYTYPDATYDQQQCPCGCCWCCPRWRCA